MRIAPVITLSPEQRTLLESQVRSRSLPLRVVERSRIVLFAASGRQDKDIAVLLSMTPKKVLAMYYYEDFPISEIAACLNLPATQIEEILT